METRRIKVGSVFVGGDAPVSVQTMWKSPLSAVTEDLIARVNGLAALGCDILRFAVPDEPSALVLGELAGRVGLPLVADIHFDYRLALLCLDFPVAKIRINPGNIGARWKVEEVVKKASDTGTAIRVGVNHGSLPRSLAGEKDAARAMVKAAEEEVEALESLGFRNVIVSMKSSDMESTVRANRLFAGEHDIPLHLGVTEAGPLIPGIVKSALALADLLRDRIGATIRVSLSDSSEAELYTGREILSVLGLRRGGVRLVSCPRCGRAGFDVHGFLAKNQDRLMRLSRDITVAVMGCVVNGPGEARNADIGITGAGGRVILFKRGEILKTLDEAEAEEAFWEELEKL